MKQIINNKLFCEIFFKEKLLKIIEDNTLSNAYIFYGPKNIGKKEYALKFISEFIKRNNSDIKAYEKIKQNNYPDYLIIEPTYLVKGLITNQSEINIQTKQTTKPLIRIEQIRKIKDFLSKKSLESEKKFILINDAHLFNESSSNCLLKTLEEPANAVFILLTSKLNLLLDTIISRCQIIRFKPYSNKELRSFYEDSKNLSNEFIVESKNIENLIYISNGSPGQLMDNLALWNNINKDIKNAFEFPLKEYVDILLLAKNVSSELNINEQNLLLDYIQRSWWEISKSKKIAQILEDIKINLKANVQPRLAWEVGLLKIKLLDF